MCSNEITLERIYARGKAYCKLMNLKYDEIFSRSRKAQYVQIRAVMMYVMRTDLKLPFTTIAHYFKRDHSTVMHHCREIEHELDQYHDTQRIHRVLKHGIQVLTEEAQESLDYENSRGVRIKTTRQEV